MINYLPVNNATLNYRPTGSTAWQSAVMSDTNNDGVLEAIIPANSVNEIGLDYFFESNISTGVVTSQTYNLSFDTAPKLVSFSPQDGNDDVPTEI